jgi:predicted dehydrogenase
VTATRSLGVGLIGYGLGGRPSTPADQRHARSELTAIATSVPARQARRPPSAGADRAVPDQLFTRAPARDLVVVSTPHHTHAPLARAALAAAATS